MEPSNWSKAEQPRKPVTCPYCGNQDREHLEFQNGVWICNVPQCRRTWKAE